jgi:hypothetical protein
MGGLIFQLVAGPQGPECRRLINAPNTSAGLRAIITEVFCVATRTAVRLRSRQAVSQAVCFSLSRKAV